MSGRAVVASGCGRGRSVGQGGPEAPPITAPQFEGTAKPRPAIDSNKSKVCEIPQDQGSVVATASKSSIGAHAQATAPSPGFQCSADWSHGFSAITSAT